MTAFAHARHRRRGAAGWGLPLGLAAGVALLLALAGFGATEDAGGHGPQKPSRSYRARRNRIAKPIYVDRAANDFRLRRGTACWRVVGR